MLSELTSVREVLLMLSRDWDVSRGSSVTLPRRGRHAPNVVRRQVIQRSWRAAQTNGLPLATCCRRTASLASVSGEKSKRRYPAGSAGVVGDPKLGVHKHRVTRDLLWLDIQFLTAQKHLIFHCAILCIF